MDLAIDVIEMRLGQTVHLLRRSIQRHSLETGYDALQSALESVQAAHAIVKGIRDTGAGEGPGMAAWSASPPGKAV